MQSIVFIIPYFGPFPFWMEYFLASCAANQSVDFLLISDNSQPENLPANFKYQQMTFDAYKRRVSDKLGIKFNPDSPYKLCDVKPVYGLVHYEEIVNYDFWGFCDIDVVFGDIRKFMTPEILSKYDFISAFGRRVSGHFFLMRNSEENNSVFKRCPDWKAAFVDEKHHCFDEKSFSDLFIRFKNHPKVTKKLLSYWFLPLSRKALFKEQYSTPDLRYNWVDGSRNFPTEWYWSNGKLTNNGAEGEFLYLHFLKWKRDWSGSGGTVKLDLPVTDKWKVKSSGFENDD